MTTDSQKKRAALKALDFVENGMTLGLGTGSTAEHFVHALAERVKDDLSLTCVSTSLRTADLAESLGIGICDIDDVSHIDLTVDGADEVDSDLQLIKGGGGALLREKIVAAASDRMVVIVDEGKVVDPLGAFPLPVEVVPFGMKVTAGKLARTFEMYGCPSVDVQLRQLDNGEAFVTDGGHFILDCSCSEISQPKPLAEALSRLPGVVDHGLFIDIASVVIIGRDNEIDILEK